MKQLTVSCFVAVFQNFQVDRVTHGDAQPGSPDSDRVFSSHRAAAGGGQQTGAAREPGAGAQPADAVPGVRS